MVLPELQRERIKRLDLSADKVLQGPSLMGFTNMLDYISVAGTDAYVDLSKLTRHQTAAIQEITNEVFVSGTTKNEVGDLVPIEVKCTKFKSADKRGAIELLGKHLKLWADKVEQIGA
jgi:hypothetical protein